VALAITGLGKPRTAGGKGVSARVEEDRGNWSGARKRKIRKPLRSWSGGHQNRVFAVAGGILRNREDVEEDIAQQVFLKGLLFDKAVSTKGGVQHLAI